MIKWKKLLHMRYYVICFISATLFLLPTLVHAASDVEVLISDLNGETIANFHPFGEAYRGTASASAADLGDDGIAEIIIGSGPGIPPVVKTYRQDGSAINEFTVYADSFRGGVTVAACDLDGDGTNEIVTGTMNGGGPHVRMFTSEGYLLYGGGFFAYAGDFRGGVNVACGDVDGDGLDDIVTGPGVTGGPHVRVFDPLGNMKYEIFAGSASENTGASVAVGDVNGDGDDEIIAGRMGMGSPTVMAFDLRNSHLSFLLAFDAFEEYENGINVTSGDIDGDGTDEIGVSMNRHELGHVRFFENTGVIAKEHAPFANGTEKGVITTTVPNGGHDHVLMISSTARTTDQVGKYIKVDISEQRLYAYENGALVNSFLISSGTYEFPTPLGKTEVMAKLPVHRYTWSYGPGNPNNYDLPGVKWNLRFRNHYYLHSAYWHNNFGNRMSHGCVNIREDNAKWIYDWADVGTPVEVVQ